MATEKLNQFLIDTRLEKISSDLLKYNVTTIEGIKSLKIEEINQIKNSLPILIQKRFQREIIEKFDLLKITQSVEPPPLLFDSFTSFDDDSSSSSSKSIEPTTPTTISKSGKEVDSSPKSIEPLIPTTIYNNGKEVGEFVPNDSEEIDLDVYLDSRRIEDEIKFEGECFNFLIDIISQRESHTLYSRCNFDEGARDLLESSIVAHLSRRKKLRKYRLIALEREEDNPYLLLPEPVEVPMRKTRKHAGFRIRFHAPTTKEINEDEGIMKS